MGCKYSFAAWRCRLSGSRRANPVCGPRPRHEVLLDFNADAEKIRNETMRMLSGPGRRPPVGATSPQLVIACPKCSNPIETITTDRPNTTFRVTAAGDRICPVCGKSWKISYTVTWDEQLPKDTPPE